MENQIGRLEAPRWAFDPKAPFGTKMEALNDAARIADLLLENGALKQLAEMLQTNRVYAELQLRGAEDELRAAAKLRAAVDHVLTTFESDEAQGYRSRDRQFAISILRQLVPAAVPEALVDRDSIEQQGSL